MTSETRLVDYFDDDSVGNSPSEAYSARELAVASTFASPHYIIGWANKTSDGTADPALALPGSYTDVDVYDLGVSTSSVQLNFALIRSYIYSSFLSYEGVDPLARLSVVRQSATTGAYTVESTIGTGESVGVVTDGSSHYYLAVTRTDMSAVDSYDKSFPYMILNDSSAVSDRDDGGWSEFLKALDAVTGSVYVGNEDAVARPTYSVRTNGVTDLGDISGYHVHTRTGFGTPSGILSIGSGDAILEVTDVNDNMIGDGGGIDVVMLPIGRAGAFVAPDFVGDANNTALGAYGFSGIEGRLFHEMTFDTTYEPDGASYEAGHWFVEDINGDGYADGVYIAGDMKVYTALSDGSGFGTPTLAMEHGGPFMRDQVRFTDINGDGYRDMVLQGIDNRFWANYGSASGFDSESHLVAEHGGPFSTDPVDFVDMTGDGKADLLFQGVDNRFWMSAGTDDGFAAPFLVASHGGPYDPRQVNYGDVDGDGKADLLFQGVDNRFWVASSEGAVFGPSSLAAVHGGDYDPTRAAYADVNGDGKVDLLYQGGDNQFWFADSDSTGFGYPSNPSFAAAHTDDAVGEGEVYYADITGDGMDDIIYEGADNWLTAYVSTGTGFEAARPYFHLQGDSVEGQVIFADVTGDGRADLIRIDDTNRVWLAASGSDTFF